jgi:nicotinamide-nucleotide amidase
MFTANILNLATRVITTCTANGTMVCTAESCTGGLVSAALTAVAGASSVVDRGFITYSNAAKTAMLGVNSQTLHTYGAVSTETAREMAIGAIANADATVAVAITGIAGPGGGSPQKPVGLVHFASTYQDALCTTHHIFKGDRTSVRQQATETALRLLLQIQGEM